MFSSKDNRLGSEYIRVSIISLVISAVVLVFASPFIGMSSTITFIALFGLLNIGNIVTGVYMNAQEDKKKP